MIINVEQLVEQNMTGETKAHWENLDQYNIFYRKSHISWNGIEPGHRFKKPATNHLSCE
jgi:hypothetical protein